MSRYGNRYFYDIDDDDVAIAALEALEQNLSLEDLLKKNKDVLKWFTKFANEREYNRARAEKAKINRQKALERKKIEDNKRAEIAQKLSAEELMAFGLNEKGQAKR